MNKTNEIKKMLDAYFAGETTQEQEESLRIYFTSADVEEELKQYQPLFVYFANERDKLQNKRLNDKSPKPHKHRRKTWLYAAACAACAAILLAVFLPNKRTNPQEDIFEGSFAIVNGKCITDRREVAKIAGNIFDIFLQPNEAIMEVNTFINTHNEILAIHARSLEELMMNYEL
jgi:hypothetical protein